MLENISDVRKVRRPHNKTYMNTKILGRNRRHNRIRARLSGTPTRPRLAVFKSNRYVYVQLIDDTTSTTLACADTRKQEGKTLTERAIKVGTKIAQITKEKGINEIVFDRGGFVYTGLIKALADAARAEGLTF